MTSGLDSVVVGKEGWLYYADSVNDYTGQNVLSDRAIVNIVNNVSLMQEYVESKGKTFIFTVAPNKNTLYPEYMPSNIIKVSEENNLAKLEAAIDESDIVYTDLKGKLSQYDETLYYARDSHWNDVGALVAFNELLDTKNLKHEKYDSSSYKTTVDYKGDLSEMIYPEITYPEKRYSVNYEKNYEFTSEADDVEDSYLTTVSSVNNGLSLLMYRDSFGNALIPYMANTFKKSTFSSQQPYLLETDLASSAADTVIVEKVERKLDELSSEAPLITGIEASLDGKGKLREVYTETTLSAAASQNVTTFTEISGKIDSEWIDEDSPIYIRITNDDTGDTAVYQAFLTTQGTDDFGYTLYLNREDVNYENAFIEVIGKQGKFLNVLYEDSINLDI